MKIHFKKHGNRMICVRTLTAVSSSPVGKCTGEKKKYPKTATLKAVISICQWSKSWGPMEGNGEFLCQRENSKSKPPCAFTSVLNLTGQQDPNLVAGTNINTPQSVKMLRSGFGELHVFDVGLTAWATSKGEIK